MSVSSFLKAALRLPTLWIAIAVAAFSSTTFAQNAYVANQANNTVAVVNTTTNALCTTSTCHGGATYPIPVGTTPSVVAVTPNNAQVYVLNTGSNSVSVISTATDTVTTTISVPGAFGLVISPDGKKVYVPGNTDTSVISTASNTIISSFSPSFQSVAMSPDGRTLFGVTGPSSGGFDAVNTSTFATSGVGCEIGETVAFPIPNGQVYSSDSIASFLFVCNPATGANSDFSTDANVTSMILSSDGSKVYTAGTEIQVINISSSSVSATISTASSGLATMPKGSAIYSVSGSSISVINPSSNTVTSTIPVSGGNLVSVGIQPPDLYQFAKDLGPKSCGCDGAQSAILAGNTGAVVAGEPIDVGSGNVAYQTTDYKTAGQNLLDFTRFYNSLGSSNGNTTFATSLGSNWRSTYDRYIQIVSSSQVIVERPGGGQLVFTLNGSTWTSDSDVDVTLTHSGSTWTLTDHDDTIETYTTASTTEALLSSIKARNGYTQVLNYNGSNQLTSVTDSYSRSLTLTYVGGLLNTVTTPDSTTLTYAYTAVTGGNRLTSVTYSTSPATSQTYLYTNTALPFALTGITDENGNSYSSWTYDGFGRGLTSQQGSGANLTAVAYNLDNSRAVTNPLGVVDTYSFNIQQGTPKATQVSRASTSTTPTASETLTYDSNGYRASLTDWNGNQTTYTNNSHGMPTTINEAVGSSVARTTTIAYDTTWVHLPHTITTPGVTSSFTYDGSGEELTKTLTDTTTTTIPYSTNGQTRTWTNTWSDYLLASVKTPNGNTSSFVYTSNGALTSVTDALSHVTNITASTGGGLPKTIVDPNSVTATLTYSPRQWLLTSAVSGSGGTFTTTYTYDAAGNLTKKTLPDSSYLANTYDAAHRLTKITDALGNYTSYTLDALGDKTQVKIYNSGGTLTKQHSDTFDALGRPWVDTAGAGQTTTYTYDPDGNVLTVEDGLSHTATNTYDALNRQKSNTDANSGVSTTTYDPHDRPLTVTDRNTNATSFVYNGFGNAIQQVSPDTGTTVYYFDGDSNQTKKVDAASVTVNLTYDPLDRLLTKSFPADTTQNVTYTYDGGSYVYGFPVGRLATRNDAAGLASFDYDERGNLLQYTRWNGGSPNLTSYYAYDNASRINDVAYPSGLNVSYFRDAAGNINDVTYTPPGGSGAALAALASAPFGPPTVINYQSGVNSNYTLDLDYRITNVTATGGATTLENQTYAYDNANNVTSITDSVNTANSQTLGYDSINRLTSATSGTGGYGTKTWTYDKSGNMLTNGSSSYVATYTTGTNQVATYDFPGTNSVYHYTPTGNLSSVTVGSTSYDTATYNVANRLASLTNTSLAYSNVYDDFGRRFSKTDSGSAPIYYTYAQDGNLLEENDNGAITDYIYVNGRPIGTFVPGGSTGTLYYINTDRLGTPQFVTNSSKAVVWSTLYAPYGDTGAVTGTITQNLRFPGQYIDHEGPYGYNLNRDYIFGFGRYGEADRIGLAGGLNSYRYANDNPFKNVDPTGTQTVIVIDNNAPIIGTHAGLFVTNGLDNAPTIYDPSGSYDLNVGASGPNGFIPPPRDPLTGLITGADADWNAYYQSMLEDGDNVQFYIFNTTPEEEAQIIANAENLGDPRGFNCANFVSAAIRGVGPFDSLGHYYLPSSFGKAIAKLQNQLY